MQIADLLRDPRKQEGETREQNRKGEKSIGGWILNWPPLCSSPWNISRSLQSFRTCKRMAVVHQFLSTMSSHFQRGPGAGSKDRRAQGRCQKLVKAFMEVTAMSGIEKEEG